MEFKKMIFAIIIFSMIVTASGVIVTQWALYYHSGIASDLGLYNKQQQMADLAQSQKGKINPQSGEASTDYEQVTYKGGWGIISSIHTSFDPVIGDNGLINQLSQRFGIPNYIQMGIVSMIVIAIIFAIIALIFRKPGDTA